MFRPMKRSKQLLSAEETVDVMERCTCGVLACLGDDDYAYAVPLSYVYYNMAIYFHSAKAGHKIDALLRNPKVSFAVIDDDRVVSAEYTTYYRSVIAFGKTRIVEGDEWFKAFRALVEKYSGEQPEEEKREEVANCSHSLIVAIDVEQITGKAAIELVRKKRDA
jgi:uncharacterized protein